MLPMLRAVYARLKLWGGGLEAAIVTILTHTNAAWDLRS